MTLRWTWLGRVPYLTAVAQMEALRRQILAGQETEALLLLEHPPVITLGRRARPEHLLVSREVLSARGIAIAESTRGGEVTYHGPGQLVAYPVVRLDRGVVAHVEALAQAAVEVAADFGLKAAFDRACPGVWAEGAKLASVGVHVHRRVAIHGLALNVTTALDAFSLIVPCGQPAGRLTSIAAATGAQPEMASLAAPFAAAFARASGRALAAAPDHELLLQRSLVE